MNAGMVTLIEGITSRTPEGVTMIYRPGCQFDQPNVSPFDWSVYQAAASDVTIAMMGLSPLMEGEEGDAILTVENGDRSDIALSASQADYLKKMIVAGAKVVLVLTGGAPIALGELADMVEAVVYVWYPGEQGGNAVADVLFGNVVPGGKLPITFPKSLDQLPPFENYDMVGRTHRFMTEEPLYPFGFGLSYTRFSYDGISLDRATVQPGESVIVTVTVTNCGSIASDEVVQLYLSDLDASVPAPRQNLIGFRRVRLEPGGSAKLAFEVTPEMMLLVNEEGETVLEPGEFRLSAGGSAPVARSVTLGASEPASATFIVAA
jgi:beta-glucosidase